MTVDLRNACTEDVSNKGSFGKASTGTESVPVYAFRSLEYTPKYFQILNFRLRGGRRSTAPARLGGVEISKFVKMYGLFLTPNFIKI